MANLLGSFLDKDDDLLRAAAESGGKPILVVVVIPPDQFRVSVSCELRHQSEGLITELAETICQVLTQEIAVKRRLESNQTNPKNSPKGD